MSDRERRRDKSAQLRAELRAKQRRRSMMIQVGVVFTVALVVIAVTVAVLVSQNDAATVTDQETPANLTSAGGVLRGSPSAPVTVTVVEDFQCPACRAFEEQVGETLQGYAAGTDVSVEYRPIAFLDRASTTDYSSRALNAAACVVDDDPDNYPAIHDVLYAQQPAEGTAGLTDDVLIDFATEAGMDRQAATSCIEDRAFGQWVTATTEGMLEEDFFAGTPTVLVNEEKVEDVTPAGLEAAVQAAS